MDRRRLGRIFSVGLALAEVGCNTDRAPHTDATPAPSGDPAGSAPSSLDSSSMAPRTSAPAETVAATGPAPSASTAPALGDAEAFVSNLKKVDLTRPAALGGDAELVGFVVRRDGNVICDPAPCAREWSSLLPSVADHAIVRKEGKLVAVSKETFTKILGPVETPAAAATRVRLQNILAVCKRVGSDDVQCAPSQGKEAYYDASVTDGIAVAVFASPNVCQYGVQVPGKGPTDPGVRFVRVASDGVTAPFAHPLAERIAKAQRVRNPPNCDYPVKRGRIYEGFRDTDSEATLIEYHARAARHEAAAVVAFERLAAELASFGAPAELVDRARRAATDERRHAALFAAEVQALADAAGIDFASAALDPCASEPRSLEALLLENAVEGCVHETYAAVVATHQAEHAPLPHLRDALRALAADERDHAALAYAVHAWGVTRLAPEAARRVTSARVEAAARARLAPEATLSVARALGEPDAHLAWRAFDHVAAALAA